MNKTIEVIRKDNGNVQIKLWDVNKWVTTTLDLTETDARTLITTLNSVTQNWNPRDDMNLTEGSALWTEDHRGGLVGTI